jgi:hypothetical protein
MRHVPVVVVLIAVGLALAACAPHPRPITPPSPWAPTTTRNFTSDGVGVFGCDTWDMARRVNHDQIDPIESWVLGFISGLTYAQGPKYKTIDQNGVQRHLDEYCQANPRARIQDAAIALAKRIPETNPPKPGDWEAPVQIP